MPLQPIQDLDNSRSKIAFSQNDTFGIFILVSLCSAIMLATFKSKIYFAQPSFSFSNGAKRNFLGFFSRYLVVYRYAWVFFEKLPGANKFISDFLNPKYPGMTGYPGYEVEEKEEKGTQLNFSKYDRFEEFQENPGYPYYIDYSDLASSDEGVVHQILSPISNSESTNFFY